jgi:hypothetical protein
MFLLVYFDYLVQILAYIDHNSLSDNLTRKRSAGSPWDNESIVVFAELQQKSYIILIVFAWNENSQRLLTISRRVGRIKNSTDRIGL